MTGIAKVLELLDLREQQAAARVSAVSHGTTVRNQPARGKVGELGFITTEGYEAVLEIARQSVPGWRPTAAATSG